MEINGVIVKAIAGFITSMTVKGPFMSAKHVECLGKMI